MLILVEREHKVPQHRLQVGGQLRTGILFQSGESAASGFLDSLVVIEDHAKELEEVGLLHAFDHRLEPRLTPSIVGIK